MGTLKQHDIYVKKSFWIRAGRGGAFLALKSHRVFTSVDDQSKILVFVKFSKFYEIPF